MYTGVDACVFAWDVTMRRLCDYVVSCGRMCMCLYEYVCMYVRVRICECGCMRSCGSLWLYGSICDQVRLTDGRQHHHSASHEVKKNNNNNKTPLKVTSLINQGESFPAITRQ